MVTRKYVDYSIITSRNVKGVTSALRRGQWLLVSGLSHEDIQWLLSLGLSAALRERLVARRNSLGQSIISNMVTTPGITDLMIKHASAQQRAQFIMLCRETSTAAIKAAHHESAREITTIVELENLVASGSWRAVLDSPSLPADSHRVYPLLRDIQLASSDSSPHPAMEKAGFRLYDNRYGPLLWHDTPELRDLLQHTQHPMRLSLHARQAIVTHFLVKWSPPDWIWRFRCEQVQAHVAATLGWATLIRHGQILQSDIRNPNITEPVVLHPAVYAMVSRHPKFLLVLAKRDWADALRRYLANEPPSAKCIGYMFRHDAHRCIASITSTEEDVSRVIKIIVENKSGKAGLRYLKDLLSGANQPR